LRDKTDLIADRELIEPSILNTVAVEIDLIAVGAQDEAALAAGDFEVDANPEQIAPKPAGAPAFDDDAARCNPIAEPFELLGRRVPVSLKTQILPGSLTKILEDVQIALLPPLLMF
jgi:hypothetical protein